MNKTQFNFTGWLNSYCEKNTVRPIFIEGACRAYFFSFSARSKPNSASLEDWLESNKRHLELDNTQLKALEDLHNSMVGTGSTPAMTDTSGADTEKQKPQAKS